MPKMTGSLVTLKISKSIFNQYRSRFRQINKDGVRAWVETAASIIPQWSGMSRATLKKLGNRVGVQVAAFPVPGSSGRQPPNRTALGQQQSQGELIEKKTTFGFKYSTSVFHLAINEILDARQFGFRLRNPGPYNFRLKSDLAYIKEINRQLRSFDPQLKKFIKVRRIKL